MKVVVITGSARGFGLAMIEEFYKKNYNVVILDVNEEELEKAKERVSSLESKGKVLPYKVDVTNEDDVKGAINNILKEFKTIDIWINNAGVNQPSEKVWDLEISDIRKVINIDLIGTMICSNIVVKEMIKQGYGQIYNVEGHGSNDAIIDKLTVYGTAKRGITYFTDSLASELKDYNITVGKITPGIMITNFIYNSLGDGKKIEIDEKTKKIYNILGDYPETIAKFMVNKIDNNKKKNVKFTWLTSFRAFTRFMSYPFAKRNLFK